MALKKKPVTGMKDLLPEEMALHHRRLDLREAELPIGFSDF